MSKDPKDPCKNCKHLGESIFIGSEPPVCLNCKGPDFLEWEVDDKMKSYYINLGKFNNPEEAEDFINSIISFCDGIKKERMDILTDYNIVEEDK